MLLKEAIEDYLLYLQHEQSASRETIRTYRPSLRRFLEWVQANGQPVPTIQEITTPLARRYLYHLSEQGLRPRSRLRYWLPVRSLFRMLVEHGGLTENPVASIALPKKDPAQRLLVTDAELLQVLEAAGRQRCAWRAARDQAVLAVLIYTGLRRAEVIGLKVGDVNLDPGTLRVTNGKGNKARVVPLCAEAKAYLERWLAFRPAVEHDYLFTTDQVRRLAENGLKALIETAKTTAGLAGAENIKPHSIRHAAATRLLQNGADIRSVMAWLGHSHLRTTAVYLHTDEQRLQSLAHLASIRPANIPAPEKQSPEAVGNPRSARLTRRVRRTAEPD
jgi:site-specific recombinase XerD